MKRTICPLPRSHFFAYDRCVIPRYSRSEMTQVWSDEARLKTWTQIEIQAVLSRSHFGAVPRDEATLLKKAAEAATVSWDRVLELESTLKHDVIAFLTAWNEKMHAAIIAMGHEESYAKTVCGHLHFGMTSSDVVDTALSLNCSRALKMIDQALEKGMKILKTQAEKHRSTICVGRTHGIHGEPTVMGMKFLLWYADIARLRRDLKYVSEMIAVGKLSGAVGTAVHLTPEVESHFCKGLGLDVEPVATQVIQRDRHARLASFLALAGAVIEKISVELRHWQRTEVREAEEAFSQGQKGSSAMPHKKNPISAENLTGCGRMLKSYVGAAFDNVALWHERDISHSSVERVFLPDAFILADYALHRLFGLIENLNVSEARALQNLEMTGGLIYSQKALLVLIEAGMTRDEAYALVQEKGMKVWEGAEKTLCEALLSDPRVSKRVARAKLEDAFRPEHFLKSIDFIYQRTFEAYESD